MSVAVRLRRTGAKNNACFRVVAADKRSPRDGRFIENLGWYDPSREGEKFELKLDRIEHWANSGAEISDTVKSLVKQANNPSGETKPKVKKLAREKAEKATAAAAEKAEEASAEPASEEAPVEAAAEEAPAEKTEE